MGAFLISNLVAPLFMRDKRTQYQKYLAALATGVLGILSAATGMELGITENDLSMLFAAITPIVVSLVPNKS